MQFSPFRQHNLQNTHSQGSNSIQIYPTSKYYNFQNNLMKNRLFQNNIHQQNNKRQQRQCNKENKNTLNNQKIININKDSKKDFAKKNYYNTISNSSRIYDLKRQQKSLTLRNQKKNSKKGKKSMSIMMQNDNKRVLLQQQLRHYIKLSSVLRKRNQQLEKRNVKQNEQYKRQIKQMKEKIKTIYQRAQKKQKVQKNSQKFLQQKYPTIKFNDKIDFKYGKRQKKSGKKSVRVTSKIQNQCIQSEIKINQTSASQNIKNQQMSQLFDSVIQKTQQNKGQYYQFFKTFTKSLQIFKQKTIKSGSYLNSYGDQYKKQYKNINVNQAKQIWLSIVQFLIKHNFHCKN